MRASLYTQLKAIARRESGDAGAAEDMVQEALLAAVLAGRTDFDSGETARWLCGTVRNRARMEARTAVRRRRRETQWHGAQWHGTQWLGAVAPAAAVPAAEPLDATTVLAGLPPALKAVAALTLSGHRRREIAWLLNLTDTALRQRIKGLKRHLVRMGLAMPQDLPGLTLNLAYGRIREALLPQLLREGGVFASHDPDGHLFIVRRSQKPVSRQQET